MRKMAQDGMTKLWNLARRYRPRVDAMCVTRRDLPGVLSPVELAEGFELARVEREADAAFDVLCAAAATMRVSREGCIKALSHGDAAFVVFKRVDGKTEPAGMAWTAFNDLYVREVSGTFQAGADSCYFYYDFVRPTFRGHGLQRAMIVARLRHAMELNRRWAYAFVHRRNTPSLNNYRATGFVDIARSKSFRIGSIGVAKVEMLGDASAAPVTVRGWPVQGRRTLLSVG